MQQVLRLMHFTMYSSERRGAFTFHLLAFLIREPDGGRMISKCLHNTDTYITIMFRVEIECLVVFSIV